MDIDRIVQLKPDLIVATPDTDSVDLAQTVRRTQAPLLQPRLDRGCRQAAIELGYLVGERRRAGSSRTSRSEKAEIEQRLGDAGIETVFVDRGFFITVPDQSLLGSLIRDARGRTSRGSTRVWPVSARTPKEGEPDVYLTTRIAASAPRPQARSPNQGLKAVKTAASSSCRTTRDRPGPNVTKGLEAVAVALHPDAFR